jgi:phosphatidate cytidylyltransferase
MADGRADRGQSQVKRSDLPIRALSAVVMIAVAGAALWFGGKVLAGFIWLVALVGFGEFVVLALKATAMPAWRVAAILAGGAYFGIAAWVMASLDNYYLLAAIGVVIFTDTGAYFTGRTIGGPKIAPRISPSKTWAGLFGGMFFAALWLAVVAGVYFYTAGYRTWSELIDVAWDDAIGAAMVGAVLAVVAQAGDFFQSWLKRRAGVKDSSKLIPGHGGVFDRIDGMLAVALVVGFLSGFG